MRQFIKVEPFLGEDGVVKNVVKLVTEEDDFLSMCYRELDCRCIDIITAEYLPEGFCMIVDDEFLLGDKLLNTFATSLYDGVINGAVLIGKDLVEPDGIRTVGLDATEATAFLMVYCR